MELDLIRITEAAQMLQVSKQTVRNMIDRGHFPGAKKMDPTRRNSPYRIPRAEVSALADGNKIGQRMEGKDAIIHVTVS